MIRSLSLLLLVVLAACGGKGEGAEVAPRPGYLEVVAGATPDATLDALVDFGNVTLGALRSRTVVLRNAGDLPLTLEVVRPDEPFATDAASSLELGPGEEWHVAFEVLLRGTGLAEATVRIGWSDGALDLRLRASGAMCELVITEQGLDFGVVQVGGSVVGSLTLINDGEGTCTLEAVEGDDAAFDVVERARTMLLPGTRVKLEVGFAPVSAGEARGTLRFTVEGVEYEVPLFGAAIERCVRAAPEALDFDVFAACGWTSARDSVWLHNDCAVAITWPDVSIEQNGDRGVPFFLGGSPAPGERLAAGASRQVVVHLEANVTEPISAILQFAFADGVTLEVPLTATPSNELPVVTFETPIDPTMPIDVLVVVDDTERMLPWTAELDAFAGSLVTRLQGHDFQIGVTTVSRVTADGCSPAPDGRLLPLDGSEPRILDRDTPALVDTLAARLRVGTCQSSAAGAGLAAAVRAVGELGGLADDPTHPEADDGNLGFLRPDSHLLLLFLVASDDHSSETIGDLVYELSGIRAPFDPGIGVQTWHEVAGAVCDGGGSARYVAFTDQMFGAAHNLCFSPWPAPLPVSFPPAPSTYYLVWFPSDANADGVVNAFDLRVSIDGTEVLPYTDEGAAVWTFYPETNSVRFYDGHRPRGGQHLTVTYTHGCF